MIYIEALLIGLVGSLHCAGMCGPIAVAIPLRKESLWIKISGSFLYNFGRVITYGIMGAVFGVIGHGLALGGLQRWVSIITGVVMIIAVLFPTVFSKQNELAGKFFSGFGKFKSLFSRLLSNPTHSSLFAIGLLNGLLPCGLVYIAIFGAIGTGNIVSSILFMMLFGLGTVPMLMAINLAGNIVSGTFRQKISKLIPVVVVIVGLLFILRGLNLGIPYISPPAKKLHPHEKVEKMNGGGCCG